MDANTFMALWFSLWIIIWGAAIAVDKIKETRNG